MSNENEKKEKKYGKIQWFFFVIFIPLLFAITLSLVILTVAGLNIFDLAKDYGVKVPGVTQTDEAIDTNNSIYDLQATIEDQKAVLEEYKSDVQKKEETITSLNEQIEELQAELNRIRTQKEEKTIKLQELAEMYATMSTKNASAILSELENQDAIDIFINMDTDIRAAIIEKMDPARAAEITRLLKPDEVIEEN